LSTTLMLVMHSVGEAALPASLPPEAVDNFLFFWLPNQIAIFALGFTLFFVLSNASIHERLEDYAKNKQTRVFVVGALFLVALTQFGTLKFVDSRPPWIPSHFLTACVFALLMAVLMASDKPLRIVVNPFLTKLGEVSFSAYLLHFAVLELARAHAQLLGLDANRVETLIRLPITLFLVLLITFALSSVTYRVVELPMIGLGRRIK